MTRITDVGGASLVVPAGWVVDEAAVIRLGTVLAAAGTSVDAVAPTTAEAILSGSSYRVDAERAALDRSRGATAGPADGPVLVREGRSIDDLAVVLVEPTALAHRLDPLPANLEPRPATAFGRPPFPQRPVVVVHGWAPPPANVARLARDLVNGLVDRGVEARLALPVIPPGRHLTGPCSPGRATISALRPDVVIALDRRTEDEVDEWLGDDRSCTVVRADPTGTDVEVLSWRIGTTRGRRRARIGLGAHPDEVVDLVHRLCAGPLVRPPPEAATEIALRRRSTVARSRVSASFVAYLPAGASVLAVERATALVEGAATAGHGAVLTDDVGAVADADVLLLGGVDASMDVATLVSDRRGDGRSTVLDADCEAGTVVAAAVGAAVTGDSERVTLLRSLAVRAIGLPVVLPSSARRRVGTGDGLALGWASSPRSSEEAAGLAEALRVLAAERGIEVAHYDDQAPLPADAAGWALHLWPGSPGGERHLAIAAFQGCPTVAIAGPGVPIQNTVDGWLLRAPATAPAWVELLGRILADDEGRRRAGDAAQDRAARRWHEQHAATVATRVIGWAAGR